MDIATATGLRGHDVCGLTLGNVRNGWLIVDAGKTGKRAEFDLTDSILVPLIERRRAVNVPHLMLLVAGNKPVTYRAIVERFHRARAAAGPACADVWLRDLRKRAGQLSPTLAAASNLLQHSSLSVTRRHYKQGDRIKPVR
jgi:integrase